MNRLPFDEVIALAGEQLCQARCVKNVLFSEGTYQIEVFDPSVGQSFWPFMQVSDEGELGDYFCSCEAAEDGACPHTAAAATTILKGHAPLHVLFRGSLWNQLCQIGSKRHGYAAEVVHKDESGLRFCQSVTGKKLFSIRPKTEEGSRFLRDIIDQRPIETEETSLKFSNLSPEELEQWREGKPSHHLSYELSFWSDLAKGLLLRQIQGDQYKITFSQEELPKELKAEFSDFEIIFYIAEVSWPEIIPALANVKSPIKTYQLFDFEIESLTFDGSIWGFRIISKNRETHKQPHGKGIELGDYVYHKGQGFYPKNAHELIDGDMIASKNVPIMLENHRVLLEKHLKGFVIDPIPSQLKYTIHFDDQHSLHIRAYLFEPGDIAKMFDHWAYVSSHGFYKIDELLFSENETVLKKQDVCNFINRHRIWLSNFEGFEIHLSNIEAQLIFHFDRDGVLCFDTESDLFEDVCDVIDFGEWVYIKERGFYPKKQGRAASALHPGLRLKPKEIPYFIRAHREDLENIQGFFSERCPVARMNLNIAFDDKACIHIDPEISYHPTHKPEQVKIFGEFSYVEGEGFSEIPSEIQLPENYTSPQTIDKKSEPYFITYELKNLRPFITYLDPKLVEPNQIKLTVFGIDSEDEKGKGYYATDLAYETEYGMIDVVDIWEGLQNKQSYLFTDAGLIFLNSQRFDWLRQIPKNRFIKGGRRLVVSTLEWIRLSVFEDLNITDDQTAGAVRCRAMISEMETFQTKELPNIEGLKSTLRPYQEKGLQWLWFLYLQGLSGLLCDDMGLGKTHQAMALLAAVKNDMAPARPKVIVICPTSVIYHWEELLNQFLPNLRVHVYYGISRSLKPFQTSDLLLTSYGTYRSEQKALSQINFNVAIFDELQIAKNASSQTHKAMRKLNATIRVGLSGTPIENRLSELKALFDLILPTYFPSDSQFRDHFVNPIEKHSDIEKKKLLAKLIQPFLLRRKKSEVLEDLPEKIEEIAYCDLSDDQKELYSSAVYRERDALLHEIEQADQPMPFLHIFALFSRLKQICDHPALITEDVKQQSGKWDLFVELLSEIRDSGQKVVVFSQYLGMLDIIERYLAAENIGFASIRGATRDRKEQLIKFKNDPHCEVFVASLQAAGVGIDLTSASVVIHYDRWWNPARENQATDRVHRIGQKRGVQVFKFVTKNTIEEHIHQIIERKRALTEDLIIYDDQDQIKQLNRNELIEVLRHMNL